MKKNFVKMFVCLWLLSLLLVACVPTSEAQIKSLAARVAGALPAQWPEGSAVEAIIRQRPEPDEMAENQILKVGVSSLIGLDPVLNYSTSSMFHNILYVGLTRQYPDTLEFLPALAEKWQVSEDQLTWTFTLRSNIPWVAYNSKTKQVEKVTDKDGKTQFVTAEDVRSNILRVLSLANTTWQKKLLLNIKNASEYSQNSVKDQTVGVEAKDDQTLVFTLTEPIPAFDAIAELPFFSPSPDRLLELIDIDEKVANSLVSTYGYGPFVSKSFTINKTAVVVRNPFWQSMDAVPTPLLNEIQFSVVTSNNKLTYFNRGTIDVIQLTQSEYKTHEASLEQQKTLHLVDGICPIYLGFKNLDLKPFSDVKNRLALAYAINRTEIVEKNFVGAAKELGYFTFLGLRAGNDFGVVSNVAFDTSQAKTLLNSALWIENKADYPTFYISSSEPNKSIGVSILSQVKAVLARTLKANYPTSVNYTKTIDATKLPSVFITSACAHYADVEDLWQQMLGDSLANQAELAELRQQVLKNPVTNDRAAAYLQLNDALIDKNAVIIPLVTPAQIWLVSEDVRGDILPLYQQFENWWIAK